MANSTKGTIFYYYDDMPTPAAVQIYGMMTKPALPGLPNQIEATSQEDEYQKKTDGVIQIPDANFQFKYHKFSETISNFEKFRALQVAGQAVKFGIAYPDGGALEFTAKPFVQRDATGVDALDTFTVAMLNVTGIDPAATKPETITMSTYAETE